MTHYIGSVPDATRQADWRTRGTCQYEDPEIFFERGAEETAKAVCRRCPVVEQCLRFALDRGIEHGVFGACTQDERRSIRRRAARLGVSASEAQRTLHAVAPPPQRTMQEVFEENTVTGLGDHLEWTGVIKPKFRGRAYTPAQLAFIVSRDRAPEGAVLRRCGTPECVRPEHLTDGAERRAASTPAAA